MSEDRMTARYVSGGFLSRRIRRIASLSGVDLRPGLPRAGDYVAVWGHAGTSARAEAVAARFGAPVLRFEDAFLRSLHPGREREPTLGLVFDRQGAYFDARQPSELESLLATHPFDDGDLIARARAAMRAFQRSGVSKYAAAEAVEPPAPGYVLVVDQTRGDASIRLGRASETTFREMLATARAEHPGTRIVIKTHPETATGHRAGHFGPEDAVQGAELETRRIAPSELLAGAVAVYTVSSQMGFEAILHGHTPVTFGQPFYAGWGLSDDRQPLDRRVRRLTRTQLFAGAMVLYPKWYDPYGDRLCGPMEVIRALEAQARAHAEDTPGWSAPGMRLWKRAHLRRFLSGRVRYRADPALRPLVWGAAPADGAVTRLEDGFLRSKGLGAELVPPLSLVLDHSGIYYDPTRPSDLEAAIIRAAALPAEDLVRARALREAIVAGGITKYNLDATPPDLPRGRRIVLVPGQVADDASVRLGGGRGMDNAALLAAARAAEPEAFLIYKPHPDVEAGLREGAIEADEADLIARHAAPIPLIEAADAVWTLTSLMGFEALMRGKPVTCLGAPFYAGWGLTEDRGPVPARRRAARPTLDALTHAALIAYPRYFDPVTGLACPPEAVLMRLREGPMPRPGAANRLLSKAQGLLASQAWLWR